MKKTYIQPSIEAVNIQLSHMVMASETMGVQSDQRAGSDGWGGIQSVRGDWGEVELED